VYWSKYRNFLNGDSASAGSDTTFRMPPDSLRVHQSYYWGVVGRDQSGLSSWAVPGMRSFYIRQDVTPVAVTVQAGSDPAGVVVSWNIPADLRAQGAQVYRETGGSVWAPISPLLAAKTGTMSYLDRQATAGIVYQYEVELLGPSGSIGRFGPASAQAALPIALSLRLAPNPTTGLMNATLALPRGGDVLLRVFDAQGREVARRTWPRLGAGIRQEAWEVRDAGGHALPSGAYWVRMEAPGGRRTVRWVVVK